MCASDQQRSVSKSQRQHTRTWSTDFPKHPVLCTHQPPSTAAHTYRHICTSFAGLVSLQLVCKPRLSTTTGRYASRHRHPCEGISFRTPGARVSGTSSPMLARNGADPGWLLRGWLWWLGLHVLGRPPLFWKPIGYTSCIDVDTGVTIIDCNARVSVVCGLALPICW